MWQKRRLIIARMEGLSEERHNKVVDEEKWRENANDREQWKK